MKLVIEALVLLCSTYALAQKLDVNIVDRQDNETEYTYVVPGSFSSQTSSYTSCNVSDTNANCNGSTTSNGFSTPAHRVSYSVRGATFALHLPDGRVAIVNCEGKFAERFSGPAGNHRSCRKPLVDNIQADFHGDKARLEWIVSLDGKKKQSETYKVLAVFEKPSSN
ncbi:MAG: hypothetical protein WAN65_22075 [Candidatus Sulfotelmatobacter sp.]